jgi:hypothetical protein
MITGAKKESFNAFWSDCMFFFLPLEAKILGSECKTSGTYAKRAKQATNKDNAAACLCFLNYLAFLRPPVGVMLHFPGL